MNVAALTDAWYITSNSTLVWSVDDWFSLVIRMLTLVRTPKAASNALVMLLTTDFVAASSAFK
jgi:hypothetical protein